jgi:hypothetical protein
MSIRAIIDQIYSINDVPARFVDGRSALQPILATLNRELPADLVEYLETCIPTENYGGIVEFHPVDTLIEENRDYVPGADTIRQGFLCIAKEGDGSQFAYCCDDRRVYHINVEAGKDAQGTREKAGESWNSLEEFLNAALKELRELEDL